MRKIDKNFLSFYYANMTDYPEIKIDPSKTALLIVDMQNEFILRNDCESLRFKEMGDWERWIPFHDRLDDIVIPNTIKLLDFFRNNNLIVTFGRIACLREDGEDRSPIQKTPGWNGIFLPVDSFPAQMIEPLAPLKNEMVFNKTTDSVTSGTNYLKVLRNMDIKTIVVTGIVTDQCVASTVRDLADEGYQIICVEDCCASADHSLHVAELKIMNMIYCYVLSSEDTIELIQNNL